MYSYFVIHEVGRSRSDGCPFSLNSARSSASIVKIRDSGSGGEDRRHRKRPRFYLKQKSAIRERARGFPPFEKEIIILKKGLRKQGARSFAYITDKVDAQCQALSSWKKPARDSPPPFLIPGQGPRVLPINVQ